MYDIYVVVNLIIYLYINQLTCKLYFWLLDPLYHCYMVFNYWHHYMSILTFYFIFEEVLIWNWILLHYNFVVIIYLHNCMFILTHLRVYVDVAINIRRFQAAFCSERKYSSSVKFHFRQARIKRFVANSSKRKREVSHFSWPIIFTELFRRESWVPSRVTATRDDSISLMFFSTY